VSGQLHAPSALPLGKSPRYPLDRRLGGPQSRSGRRGEEKILGLNVKKSPKKLSELSYCVCVCVRERGRENTLFFIPPPPLFPFFIPSLTSESHCSFMPSPARFLSRFHLAVVQLCSVIHDVLYARPELFSALVANCKREGVKRWRKERRRAITLFLEAIYF
jgi:hypothetical protein